MLLRKRLFILICQRVSSNSKLSLLKKVWPFILTFSIQFPFSENVFCYFLLKGTNWFCYKCHNLKKFLRTDRQTIVHVCLQKPMCSVKNHSIAFVSVLVDTLFELLRYAWKQINLILFLKNIYHTLQKVKTRLNT